MKRKKLYIKTLLFFMISFLIITTMHVTFNVKLRTRQPSENWSRGFIVSSSSFSREIVSGLTKQGDIVILSSIKDGKEKLGITKLDSNMNFKEDYEVSVNHLDINRIYTNEIILINQKLYWRDNKEDSLYMVTIDDDYREFGNIEKLYENVKSFDVSESKNSNYLALVFLDGKIGFFEEINGKYNELESPNDLNMAEMINIKAYNDVVYLQSVINDSDNYKKIVSMTEYRNNKWSQSLCLTSFFELKNTIKDIELATDKDYLYSIASTQGGNRSEYSYIINGYNKDSKEAIKELKLDWASDLRVYNFSSKPVMLDNDKEGISLYITAPNNLDIRVTNSNVVKLGLTKDGFNHAELVSNTKNWSSQVNVLSHENTDYVLWNEAGGFGTTIVMGTSNKDTILNQNIEIQSEDVIHSIGEEFPLFSQLTIILVGARFFSILLSMIWLLCMFFWYHKVENRYNLYLGIGIIIYTISQLTSMDFYYKNVNLMPEYLTLSLVKYAIPFIFAILGAIFASLYKKESEEPESYIVFIMFLFYNHVLMNYLFVPYLF